MNIYVGNLSYDATEQSLQEEFEQFGQVEKVTIIKDRYSGRSKGFGFVEMLDDKQGQTAIENMHNKEFMGRTLKVDEARPRKDNAGFRDTY